MTLADDPRDLCSVCEAALLPEEGTRCRRCAEFAETWSITTVRAAMHQAFVQGRTAEHRMLLGALRTLLGCNPRARR